MQVRLKNRLIVVTAETDEEFQEVARWSLVHADHAFSVSIQDQQTFLLKGLGPRAEACREPINVISNATDESIRLISNLAETPFVLHGRAYASIEGFWQGLKFPAEEERLRIAQLHGAEAKRAGQQAPEAETVEYQGARIRVGCYEHWSLMHQACWAKFTQHEEAKRALLGTGTRPLVHKTKRDSRTIPGVIMANIWMRIRSRLRNDNTAP